ncbi:hypothetical protein NXX78_24400 [Bacteroides fragilis]|nr:hypothetical protein [Bacteroides fragilis]
MLKPRLQPEKSYLKDIILYSVYHQVYHRIAAKEADEMDVVI